MFRSWSFWIVVALIAAGVAVTAALGVLAWLEALLVTAFLTLAVVFLVAVFSVGRAAPLPEVRILPPATGERIPLVYDGDVAMGRPFRDVSDGLALLCLLGEPSVELLSVTATYGNVPVAAAARTARRLLDAAGRKDVAVVPGAAGADGKPGENEAARRLCEIATARPGEVVVVATGSMTNLGHAAALDPGFFDRLRGVCLLGGVTGPLSWNGRPLAERNLSADPEAAYAALRAGCPVTVVPGQAGLSAIFRAPQFAALQASFGPVSQLVARLCRHWFALNRLYFRDGGFGMWASIAALAAVHPGLLARERVHLLSTRDDLRRGQLVVEPNTQGHVEIVRQVRDFERFVAVHLAAWQQLDGGVQPVGKETTS